MRKIQKNNLEISVLPVGPLLTNCYLAWDKVSREAFLVDPGSDDEKIRRALKSENLNLKFIIITHGHFDHTGAVEPLKAKFHCPVFLSSEDRFLYTGLTEDLKKDQLFSLGKLTFRILATPGHTPGGMALLGEGVLFSGDTLFANGCGRIDLPGGEAEKLKDSLKLLLDLPSETLVLPGHGPATTIAKEKQTLAESWN
jgi:glyoxylase-like metal-dependent hydrolase (beta-lactamase superfamily II)